MNNDLNKDQLKEFISNWSTKVIDETNQTKFDHIFTIDGTPLSWFYRPILYSSLLPRPFPTVSDILEKRKISPIKINIYGFLLRRYLVMNDWIKRKIISKNHFPTVNNKEKILFLTFTNHLSEDTKSVFRMDNIIQKIKEGTSYEPLLLKVDPISSLSLRKIRKSSPSLYQYYDRAILEHSKKESKQLSLRWKALAEKEKKRLMRFSQDVEDNLYSYLQASLTFLYSPEFINAVWKYYLTFRKIIAQDTVQGIVLSSQNNIFEKCLLAAASKEKVPVFIIQHGIGLGTLPTIDTPKKVKFAVFGEKYQQELIKLGVDKNNIAITGPIIFDEIVPLLDKERKKSLHPQIILATSPFIEDRFMEKVAYFEKIEKILQGLYTWDQKARVTIKLHPREKNKKEYERIFIKLGKIGTMTSEVDRTKHFTLIKNCDLLITFGSTVALEGMIMQKPTLTIELFDGDNPTNKLIIRSGATPVLKYDQNLAKALPNVFLNQSYQKKAAAFVHSLCYKIDGKAAERISQHIHGAIKERKQQGEE